MGFPGNPPLYAPGVCDHVGKLIQKTGGIQVLVVSTYGNKISKVCLYANKLVYIILC